MRILSSKWLLIVIIPILGWLTLSFIKIKLHADIVNNEVRELEAKIDNLEKGNEILEKFISFMSNPSFIERQARIKLNYKAPGEEVVFVYPDESAKTGSGSLDISKQNLPNYMKWWVYLFEIKNEK